MNESIEEATPARRRKKIAVRLVFEKDAMAVVEWLEGPRNDKCLRRGFIPAEECKAGKVPEDVLADAQAFGVPWEEFIKIETITPEAIANRLRMAGFWTSKDLELRTAKARKEYGRIMETSLAELRRAAHAFERGE